MRRTAGRIGLVSTALLLILSAFPSETTKTLWSITSFGQNDFLQEPSDIEVDDANALIYVVDAGSCRVLVFDFLGGFLRAVGRKGQGPGEFDRPTGMCLLKDSGIAVADFGNNRIQSFDSSGTFVRSIALTEARVADLIISEGLFYTVPSAGASGYAISMGSDQQSQPLVNVLNMVGKKILEISVADFPESQPFVRAIKHHASLSVSPQGRLFLTYSAANLIQVFEKTGQKVGEFSRPLPFKPMPPVLLSERSPEKGVVQMRADRDYVSIASKFGPDGMLYVLTVTESLAEVRKKNPEINPLPMRFDVIDPLKAQAVKAVPCDPGIRTFGLMDRGRLVYVYEDAEGELTLKCVQY